jgi:hypothetical protein
MTVKIYAVAKSPTPVLDQPNFKEIFGGNDGKSLPLDDQKLLRRIETIALKETKFLVVNEVNHGIYQVQTNDYPGDPLYVDGRFLTFCPNEPPERKKQIPSISTIITRMEKLKGTPYVWGGNWSEGIPEMLNYYPPSVDFSTLDTEVKNHWLMNGVDCSGLLYEVSDGGTPRNTSGLVSFGEPVPIENLSIEALCDQLQTLDLIAWRGHLVMVKSDRTCIESRHGKGVVETNLQERITEILKERKAVNDWYSTVSIGNRFVVRRWHPEAR